MKRTESGKNILTITNNKTDILLNVFLAIAVDNLGDAEEMDAAEIVKEKEVKLFNEHQN